MGSYVGPPSTVDSILASLPAAPGSILGIPKNFSLDAAESDSTGCNSGQRLDNVNLTHLVLASGKLVLPKSMGSNLSTALRQ